MSIVIRNAAIGQLRTWKERRSLLQKAVLSTSCGSHVRRCCWRGAGRPLPRKPMTVDHYIHRASEYEFVNTAYNQLPATLISPHIAWHESSLERAAAVDRAADLGLAQAVELKERFPSQISVVMTRSHIEWALPKKGETYHEVDPKEPDRIALTLLNRPDKYDAIIIGKVNWKEIPETVRQLILDRVATGCGLVYVGPSGLDERLAKLLAQKAFTGDSSPIAEGVPLVAFPLWDGKRRMAPGDISAAQYGQGRVVFVNYPDSGAMFQGPLIYEDRATMTADPAGNERRMKISRKQSA